MTTLKCPNCLYNCLAWKKEGGVICVNCNANFNELHDKNCPATIGQPRGNCNCNCELFIVNSISPMDANKQTFKSGATSSGKLPGYDMLTELFLTRTAKRFDLGKEKHGKFNYRKGLNDKEFIIDRLNHAFLHLKRAVDLIENDKPFSDDNLAAVAVNIAMAMEYEQVNKLDYLP